MKLRDVITQLKIEGSPMHTHYWFVFLLKRMICIGLLFALCRRKLTGARMCGRTQLFSRVNLPIVSQFWKSLDSVRGHIKF